MKKICALLLSVLLLFGCFACEKTPDGPGDEPNPPSPPTPPAGDLTHEQIADNLLDDSFLYGEPQGSGSLISVTPTDTDWQNHTGRMKRLEVGDEVVEDFSAESLYEMAYYPIANSATFYWGETEEEQVFAGKRSVVMVSNEVGGDNDFIYLKGSPLIQGARYKVRVTLKILTTRKAFHFCQLVNHEGVREMFSMSGTDSGTIVTREHEFTALSNNAYFALLVEQGAPGDKVALGEIALTRLDASPYASSVTVSGESPSYSVAYTYFDNENDRQTGVEYNWVAALDRKGLGKTSLGVTDKEITLTPAMLSKYAGWYVGAEVKVKNNGAAGAEGGFVAGYAAEPLPGEQKIPVEEDFDETGSTTKLKSVGDFYRENFAEMAFGVQFDAAWGSLTSKSLEANALSIAGYSAFINYSDAANRPAMIIAGLSFAPVTTYEVKYDLKILSDVKPTRAGFEFQYGGLPAVFVNLSDCPESNGVYSVTLQFTTLSQFDMSARPIFYLDNVAGVNEQVSFALDNLEIRAVSAQTVVDGKETFSEEGTKNALTAVGDTFKENFGTANSGVTYDASWGSLTGWDIAATENTFDGKALLMNYSDAANRPAAIIKGLTYAPNATYTLSFSYKAISEVKPEEICMELQYINVFVSAKLSSFTQDENGVVSVTLTFITPAEVPADTPLLIYAQNLQSGGAVCYAIDNIAITLTKLN